MLQLASSQRDEKLAARILLLSDELETIWIELKEFEKGVEDCYWAEFAIHGRGDFLLVNDAAKGLADHGRIAVALDLLALYSHGEKGKVDPELVHRLLTELIGADDPEARVLSQYDLTHLIAIVRDSGKYSTEENALLEWAFLPALESRNDTKTPQKFLADSPEFFVMMISYVYRRKNPLESDEPKTPQNVVSNAWNLLRKWAVIPGTNDSDGEVNLDALNKWVAEVRVLLTEADRLSPGEAHIGEVLAHSKTDEDGTWPTRPVRDFLEADSSEVIGRNFTIGVTNARGITSRSIGEGGAQERVLALKYKDLASKVADEWPRTAGLLRKIEKYYLGEAKRQDEEAARENEGFDY
ncbi:hypothetical protein NVV95_08950 [Herbiconiux sp. CPCC 205716]|uniref:Uncharacterized protein n=1 Tax=Herbiconiux gentiana TaxID=2970912 RepID=A0ABT2GEP0_9MICO|nr:hypothetical protein [Herbiconiux gentiana]MCS5714678.1 hypothetical protein [Herbiconiux gentiana]